MIEFLFVLAELCLTTLLVHVVVSKRAPGESPKLGLFEFKLTVEEPTAAQAEIRNRA